uniref:hypothetical protein n=1 Tax=Gordonia sp. B7-2 TaxID=3420932 RepID=UPI003D8F5A5E
MRNGRRLPVLFIVSAGLTAVVAGPLLGALVGIGPRYLLYRDAVSTPRSYVTDAALGIGDLPPRAVPQDWLVAIVSRVVDGGWFVVVVLVASLMFAGVGYGRLAHRLVPQAGRVGAVAAAVVAIWNPFVAERLLQGHWGLLVGYAALAWIVVGVGDLVAAPSALRWCQLAGLVAVAGLTPTGSLLAAVVLVTACVAYGFRSLSVLGVVVVWIGSAAPWLVAALVGGATTTTGSAGVGAFGLRSEPWLGPLGTALGLGGIWNVDAVPTSRTVGWAAVATGCLLVVVAIGAIQVWRDRVFRWLVVLALVVVILPVLSSFGPGRAVLEAVVDAAPGAGLLRDSQKFLALLMPAFAVAAAGVIVALRRLVPAGFALAAVILLVVAPLPDLAWGVGGAVRPVSFPAEWSAVARIVPADAGAVARWPSNTVRRYAFANEVSLDPAPRMLRAPVVESGRLTVDGREIDPPSAAAVKVEKVLDTEGDPSELADLGVGWVLVDGDSPPARVARLDPVFTGDTLRLYQIDGAQTPKASSGARAAAVTAHVLWLAMILAGAAACAVQAVRAFRRTDSAG